MSLFHNARLKLTVWYVLIIMCICTLFSLVIFWGINSELKRFERLQRRRIEREQFGFPLTGPFETRTPMFDPQVIAETRFRLTLILIFINAGILIISGGAAYFLAGRTLTPIAQMVDEQNRFITDASHQLRTPLTSLRTEMEVNLRDKKLMLKDAKIILKSNLEDVISLQSLSDHLMTLASFQDKNGGGMIEKLSLSKIIQAAIERVLPLAKSKHQTINNQVKEFTFIGNNQSLVELFIILLDNACKYSPKNTNIYIFSGKTDHKFTVSIKDEGIGIANEDIPHIFERFYRGDKSRSKESVNGFGLGLSIAQKIAVLHSGEISVASELGIGSVFTVSLPKV